MSKKSRDSYFMEIAVATASRGTCDRRKVGAVLTKDDKILSTGFNGAPRGLAECDEIGHLMIEGSCKRSVHAEINALLEIGASRLRSLSHERIKLSRNLSEVTLYVTTSPCRACMAVAINCHVQRVVFGQLYVDPTHAVDRSKDAFEMAAEAGIRIDEYKL